MRALAEVINNEKKTTGFMVDGSYVKYYDALQNIDLIDNLAVTEDGVIRSTDKTLDKIDCINKWFSKNEIFALQVRPKELKDWLNDDIVFEHLIIMD